MLPVISKFTYHDKVRIAIEKEPKPGGLLHYQLVPEKGLRTFKPAKMIDRVRLGKIATLYYLAKSIRIG